MIIRLVLGAIQENCYLVADEHKCVVIDPGNEKVVSYLQEHQLKPVAVLLTHGHFDHIGGVDALYQTFHCPIYAGKGSEKVLKDPVMNLTDGDQPLKVSAPVHYLDEGEFNAGSYTIHLYQTPGHCLGESSYGIAELNALFTGDALFKGAIGRYDFPGGSFSLSMETVRKLKSLKQNWTIYPGHGEMTTLDDERKSNPYFI